MQKREYEEELEAVRQMVISPFPPKLNSQIIEDENTDTINLAKKVISESTEFIS